MNFPWAICLERKDAAALGSFRLQAGIEVAEAENRVWLRGKRGNEELAHKLSTLCALARYEWLAADWLRKQENRIPTMRLPSLGWQPLDAWLQIEFPPAAMPATEPKKTSLQLVRSGEERDANLLLTNLKEWAGFVRQAARIRLDFLRFAVDNQGRVLIRGTPLPPLPGQRFVVQGNIAVPAGHDWQPAVSPEVLLRLLGGSNESLVLWEEDGLITRLVAEQFIPASRRAVQATQQTFSENT